MATTAQNIITPPSWSPVADFGAAVIGWYDAEDASTLYTTTGETLLSANAADVGRWKTKSTSAPTKHANQTSGAKPKRTDGAINGRRGLTGLGAQNLIVAAPLTGLQQFEIWTVAKISAVGLEIIYETYDGSVNGIVQLYNYTSSGLINASAYGASLDSLRVMPGVNTSAHIYRHIIDTTLSSQSSKLEIDGLTTGGSYYSDNNLLSAMMAAKDLSLLGRFDATYGTTGAMGELIIFNRLLVGLEPTTVRLNLKSKWGTP